MNSCFYVQISCDHGPDAQTLSNMQIQFQMSYHLAVANKSTHCKEKFPATLKPFERLTKHLFECFNNTVQNSGKIQRNVNWDQASDPNYCITQRRLPCLFLFIRYKWTEMNRETPFSTLKDRYRVFNNFPMDLKEKLSAFSFCFIRYFKVN